MKKSTKIWLITATSFILIGCIAFVGVMAILEWDFTKLSTTKYETNEYEIDEIYKDISIITDTAKIEIVPSENGKTSVICREQKNIKHSVEVKDGTLTIEITDSRRWYEHIGINFAQQTITLSLPKGEYGTFLVDSDTSNVEISKDFTFQSIDVELSTGKVINYASANDIKIKTSTGDICTEGITTGSLELSASTGKITVSDIICDGDMRIDVTTGKTDILNATCKSFYSSGSTGDLNFKNVVASEKISVIRSTGDVRLEKSDAAEIIVKTDTGNVSGTLLSGKIFFAQTDTGRVSVPKTTSGGRCEITTDTGNITFEIE